MTHADLEITADLVGNDDGPGGKPTWGPPMYAALRRLLGE